MTYRNPWRYNGKIFESEDIGKNYGMVYLIENLTTGRKYIGKKFFWSKKIKTVKGKKKRYVVESDWKDYYGSNKTLQEDIERLGVDSFLRTVLVLCVNKSACAYYEMREQIIHDAVLDEQYYNDFIGGRILGKNVKRNDTRK